MATCPNKNLQEWKDLVEVVGNNRAYYLWDKYQGEVPLEAIQAQVKDLSSSRASRETLERVREAAAKMGISIQALSDYLKGNPSVEGKGINALADTIRNVVAIAQGKEDVALTEEIVHVATAMLEQTDPNLVTSMISKIHGYKIYNLVLEAYKNNKNYQLPDGRPDIRKIKKEAVDKLIAELIINKSEGSTEFPELMQREHRSIIRQMWENILEAIRNLYKKTSVDIFEQAAARILGGNVQEGNGTNGGLYFQVSNSRVDAFYDKVMEYASRMKLVPATETEKRHYTLDGKKVARSVTEKVKEKAARKMKPRTPEQQAMDEQKRDWGTRLHDYLYQYITTNLVDKNGYRKASFGEEKITTI